VKKTAYFSPQISLERALDAIKYDDKNKIKVLIGQQAHDISDAT
jgi:hypothetical protein